MLKFKESSTTYSADMIQLKDGQSIEGIFVGQPYEFEKAFKEGDKPRFRFRVNFVIKEDNVLQCKILEGGWKLSQQLQELTHAGWDLHKCKTRISRTGSKINDTVWSATVLPTPVPETVLALVAKIALKKLDPNEAPKAAPQPAREPGDDQDFEHAPF